jgi:Asp/Glu/hydantoin racemase
MFAGVLMLDTRFPRPPGDIGSPLTFERAGIPVRFVTVAGASAARVVVEGDRSLIAAFIDAARQLAQEGAALITTSCGFLAAFQDDIARAVDVPVVTSSLLQAASLAHPGIVTFDAASLGGDILRAAGVPAGTPVQGLRPGCELHRRILDDDTTLDLSEAERNVVEAAEALVRRHPYVENIVLECTNMPPYRDAVARATGRRVHDIETLVLERWRALHPG